MAYNQALSESLRSILKGTLGLEEKKMFGGIGFLVNGNMACGVYRDDLMLRLGAADFDSILKQPGARTFDITGKPMKGWALVGADGYASAQRLRKWVKQSVDFARSLPPK